VPPPLGAAAAFEIDYRLEEDSDRAFLAALYASTREAEFASLGMPAEALIGFLEQQHHAQHRHFRLVYPEAEWLIVEQNGQRIGRLYLIESVEHAHVIDIALQPSSRGRGIGTAILTDLIEQAHARRKPVRLSVASANQAAIRLYGRLGFERVEENGLHELMVSRPGRVPQDGR